MSVNPTHKTPMESIDMVTAERYCRCHWPARHGLGYCRRCHWPIKPRAPLEAFTMSDESKRDDWRNDPLLAHLRDDAPYAVCSGCGRKSWGGNEAGSRCGMTQPDGSSCDGVFGLPVEP